MPESSPLAKQSLATSAQKFQFADLDLEREMEEREAGRRFDEGDLDRARNEAEDAGKVAGHDQAMASVEAATVRILPDILAAAQELADEQARQKQTLEAEAIRLARLITSKVLPVFAASKTYSEIEALITTCFAERPEESRIVIRLPDALLDKIEPRLEALISQTGFAGKPVLIADPSLSETQARVEWANGGADWDYAAQLADIEAAARRLVSARPQSVAPAASNPAVSGTDSDIEILPAPLASNSPLSASKEINS